MRAFRKLGGSPESKGPPCRDCGAGNPAGSLYCGECGTSLAPARACASCGLEAPANGNFCRGCGKALPGDGRMPGAYTPPHLVRQILRERSALEGEVKQVTVLFADVKHSLDLSRRLGPLEWHRVLDRLFRILAEGVHRFDGTVNQFTGDGIMALFGAPIAHEDHAQRACSAALFLRERLEILRQELRRELEIDFGVRMGLNSGQVVVGKIGDDLRMDYTAQGESVAMAARMEQAAVPGQTYLTEATASLVEGYFRLRPIGPLEVAGVAEPVPAYALAGVGARRTRIDAGRGSGLTRFVGRSEELAMLEGAFRRVESGHGEVVGVVGAAGSGKSRICFELAERLRSRGHRVYEAHCSSHERAIPFSAFVDLLRAVIGIQPVDDGPAARARVAERLVDLDPEFRADVPLVASFLGVEGPVEGIDGMATEERRDAITAFVRRLWLALGRGGPTTFLFDDLQWVDEESHELLGRVVDVVDRAPILLVANFRPEYRGAWMDRAYEARIPLHPLVPEASRELLEDLLGRHPTVSDLARRIEAHAKGNAFFLEEIVRSLVGQGCLEGDRGAYRLRVDPKRIEIPPTVEAIVGARIDRLREEDKAALQVASVIGSEFDGEVLRGAVGVEPQEVAGSLERLVAQELLVVERDEGRYAFRHPLTREVAYRSQIPDRRQGLHEAVGTAIERSGSRTPSDVEAMAHHFRESGHREKAIRYLEEAGDLAARSFSLGHARQSYGEAVALSSELDRSRDHDDARIRLTIKWAGAGLYGPTPQHLAALGDAMTAALELGDARRAARCVGWMGWIENTMGNHDRAIAHFEKCREMAAPFASASFLRELDCNLGVCHAAAREVAAAEEHFRRALGDDLSDPEPVAHSTAAYALGYLASIHLDRGDTDAAERCIGRALEIAESLGKRSLEASVRTMDATVRAMRGEWPACLDGARRIRESADGVGSEYIAGMGQCLEGYARFMGEGEPEGLATMRGGIERLESSGLLMTMSWNYGAFAEALVLAGETDEGARYAGLALDRARERDRLGELLARRALVIAAWRERDAEAAGARFAELRGAAEECGARRELAITELRYGAELVTAGRVEEGTELLTRAERSFEEMAMPGFAAEAARARPRVAGVDDGS